MPEHDEEKDATVSHRFFVVVDGGRDAGHIEAGPFDSAPKAVKKKNHLDRESTFYDHRVTEEPDHPRAFDAEYPQPGVNAVENPRKKYLGDWVNLRGKIQRHRDGNCGPVRMEPDDDGVVV